MAGWKTIEYPLVVDTWSHNISQRNIISLNAGNLRLNGQKLMGHGKGIPYAK